MPLDAVFRLHRRSRPTKTAIIEGDRRIDYRTLDRLIDGAAHALHAQGIRREMLVGVALRDTAEHLITLLALARLGAVMLPMDCRWQSAEKQGVAAHFAAERVLLEADDPAVAEYGWTGLEPGWIVESGEPYHDLAVTDDSPLLLSLSSGTTGMPKGPRVTHRQFESRFMVYWINLGLNAQDVYVSVTPLYFGGGRGFNIAMLFAGATVSLLSPRTRMSELAAHVRSVGGTVLFLVPTMIRRLLEEGLPGLALPTLRVLISSGSALHPEERLAIRERLTPNLFEFYSSTEGGGVSVLTPADCELHPDSVGRPAFRVEVEIVDEEHTPLPPGAIGRLRYRSPASAKSYYRAEGGEAFRDFLALLADNRRLQLLPEIAGLYEELRADAERIVKAKVTAAKELSGDELESIRAALKRRFGREVEIEAAVDESLIGGAVIAAGDVVIDGSLRGKLSRLQNTLTH